MSLKTLSAKSAAALDKELMSSGGFSIDQLMELAGLSVSQAGAPPRNPLALQPSADNSVAKVYKLHPPSKGREILIACGPGNNGGDGLVAARHLFHYSYRPTIYYPKRPSNELYHRLTAQLRTLGVPFTDDFHDALKHTHHVVDAIFGFSFSGEVREPFPSVIRALAETSIPVTSVDVPSSWDIETGPPPGCEFSPAALVSLTAPKPLVRYFSGRHFVGGRFVAPYICEKYGLELPAYEGVDQVVEVDVNGGL